MHTKSGLRHILEMSLQEEAQGEFCSACPWPYLNSNVWVQHSWPITTTHIISPCSKIKYFRKSMWHQMPQGKQVSQPAWILASASHAGSLCLTHRCCMGIRRAAWSCLGEYNRAWAPNSPGLSRKQGKEVTAWRLFLWTISDGGAGSHTALLQMSSKECLASFAALS